MRAIYLSSQGIGAAGAYQLVRHQSLNRNFFMSNTTYFQSTYRVTKTLFMRFFSCVWL